MPTNLAGSYPLLHFAQHASTIVPRIASTLGVFRVRLLVLALAFLLALSGCHRKTDPPGEAPTGVKVTAGEGLVFVEWDTLPDLTYWIFFQAGSSVTAATPGSTAIRGAVPPRVIRSLQNGSPYAFVMNATHADSAAGPSSPVIVAVPRLAGADWVSGAALGAPLQNLKAIAFNGSRFVAVGDAAAIFAGDYSYLSTAPPGVSAWLPATSLPQLFAANLTSVTFSAEFIALGADGSILTSADGFTWVSPGMVPSAGATMNSIAVGSVSGVPLVIAVGSGGSVFASPDLANWTPVTSNTPNDLFSVSFLAGGFVATGANGTLLTSSNGTDWTPQASNTAAALRSAAFGPTAAGLRFVAVGDAGTVVTSPDGVKWDPIALPLSLNGNSVHLNSVVFGSRFVAVGQAAPGAGGVAAYSDDGQSWTTVSTGSDALASALFSPAMYISVGAAGANAVSK
jgi:hypothetical protein